MDLKPPLNCLCSSQHPPQTPKRVGGISYLVAFFEAQAKVNELETLALRTPQDVPRLEVGVDVALAVKEGEGLQHVPGAVRDHPLGAALVAGVQEQLRHADVQELQQQAARRHVRGEVDGEDSVQSHWEERRTAPLQESDPG